MAEVETLTTCMTDHVVVLLHALKFFVLITKTLSGDFSDILSATQPQLLQTPIPSPGRPRSSSQLWLERVSLSHERWVRAYTRQSGVQITVPRGNRHKNPTRRKTSEF
jgi:hypothetical protein